MNLNQFFGSILPSKGKQSNADADKQKPTNAAGHRNTLVRNSSFRNNASAKPRTSIRSSKPLMDGKTARSVKLNLYRVKNFCEIIQFSCGLEDGKMAISEVEHLIYDPIIVNEEEKEKISGIMDKFDGLLKCAQVEPQDWFEFITSRKGDDIDTITFPEFASELGKLAFDLRQPGLNEMEITNLFIYFAGNNKQEFSAFQFALAFCKYRLPLSKVRSMNAISLQLRMVGYFMKKLQLKLIDFGAIQSHSLETNLISTEELEASMSAILIRKDAYDNDHPDEADVLAKEFQLFYGSKLIQSNNSIPNITTNSTLNSTASVTNLAEMDEILGDQASNDAISLALRMKPSSTKNTSEHVDHTHNNHNHHTNNNHNHSNKTHHSATTPHSNHHSTNHSTTNNNTTNNDRRLIGMFETMVSSITRAASTKIFRKNSTIIPNDNNNNNNNNAASSSSSSSGHYSINNPRRSLRFSEINNNNNNNNNTIHENNNNNNNAASSSSSSSGHYSINNPRRSLRFSEINNNNNNNNNNTIHENNNNHNNESHHNNSISTLTSDPMSINNTTNSTVSGKSIESKDKHLKTAKFIGKIDNDMLKYLEPDEIVEIQNLSRTITATNTTNIAALPTTVATTNNTVTNNNNNIHNSVATNHTTNIGGSIGKARRQSSIVRRYSILSSARSEGKEGEPLEHFLSDEEILNYLQQCELEEEQEEHDECGLDNIDGHHQLYGLVGDIDHDNNTSSNNLLSPTRLGQNQGSFKRMLDSFNQRIDNARKRQYR
jgi:hypothetical protein